MQGARQRTQISLRCGSSSFVLASPASHTRVQSVYISEANPPYSFLARITTVMDHIAKIYEIVPNPNVLATRTPTRHCFISQVFKHCHFRGSSMKPNPQQLCVPVWRLAEHHQNKCDSANISASSAMSRSVRMI